ncbi:uncharacterized protein LOC62_04G006475 [Vanrija pseudolonga]|uniref:Uncharacterized protein n=1 Tax=Vanrija pseudolonga TaxID=143232 RepID=A0AAF0YBM3_9TREE|nr:hypothetical protein LOC62_04G006475 [Vanrija pseudolonga]
MTITIDHSTHPHIIDQILAAAPRDSLLRLRATSTAFCHRADKVLCAHAVVSPVPRENTVNLHTPSATHPFVAGAGERLPFVPGAVETLDICSLPEGADLVPGIALFQFCPVRTLRRFGVEALSRPYAILGHVDTVVDCVDTASSDAYHPSVQITLAPPARRRVLHVHWNENEPYSRLSFSVPEVPRFGPILQGLALVTGLMEIKPIQNR